MSRSCSSSSGDIELELYFLIARFLSRGPCQRSGQILIEELEKNRLLHRSLDWMGCDQNLSFENLVAKYRDIVPNHLLQLCSRAAGLLDEELPPPIKAKPSLLGAGRYSVLRTRETVQKTVWNFRAFSSTIGRKPLVPPHNFSSMQNWINCISGRELGGSRFGSLLRPVSTLYGKIKMHRRILGHLSSVYCVIFDRTGARIFTGSDDCLIKCWSSRDGRLVATLRGHQSEICDMDVSYENTVLASGSCDKEIRIWDIRSGKPVAILQSHSAMITSIEFSPVIQGDTRYLISTGRDGNVCFWAWNVKSLEFFPQPHKFQERNCPGVAMLCSSWSSGGRFLAVGGSDHLVHIYHIPLDGGNTEPGPASIAEQNDHTDTVDSLRFSHDGLRFVTGSKDGTARIWTYETGKWASVVLNVSQSDEKSNDLNPQRNMDQERSTLVTRSQANSSVNKVYVIMVAWDCYDEFVMTSLTDFSIKVWNSRSKKLVSVLKGHANEAYCLEPHPTEQRIFLSAGHDGNVFLWDIFNGHIIMNFYNMLEGQGHGAVFDAKFSRDGSIFSCTDSHGHLLLFGFGDGKEFQKMPEQQFFHTDYRPLIRDQPGYVLDEQTQQAPHLMPPPFLVDVEGNPYPPDMQRLVPGREGCSTAQLIPSLIPGENGMPEVMQIDDRTENPVLATPHTNQEARDAAAVLDFMISQMQADLPGGSADPVPLASPRSRSVGLLREGDVAGVRQMHSNAPRSRLASAADIMALTRRVITPQFSDDDIRRNKQRKSKGRYELAWYRREKRKQALKLSRRQLHLIADSPSISTEISANMCPRKTNIRFTIRDDEPEEEETVTQNYIFTRRRKQTRSHRYSTRSNAPRRRDMITPVQRLSTITESVRRLDRSQEESFSESTEMSSVSSTSEDDFSKKARILRRSRRNVKANKEDKKHEQNRDGWDSSEDIDMESVEHTGSTTGSLFSPGEQKRKSRVVSRHINRHRRLSSTGLSTQDDDSSDSDVGDKPRLKKERERRVNVIQSESSGNEDQPSTSAKCQIKQSTSTKKVTCHESNKLLQQIPFSLVPGEPPPAVFLPPDWITRVTPCHFPFVPQMGDEVVYLRQGHECYIQQVLDNNVWKVENGNVCYQKYPSLDLAEHCRVVKIDYHLGPPTLCEVLLRPTMKKSQDFSVKFHDMPNVVDFLVLKQKYEKSIERNWKPNDRFRSIIDDSWWYGVIVEHKPFNASYPESRFQCFSVIWDADISGDTDYLSPWDLEPIPENILQRSNAVRTRSQNQMNEQPVSPSDHATVSPEEVLSVISYKPKSDDWGSLDSVDGSMDSSDDGEVREERTMSNECSRISAGLEELLSKKLYTEFCSPVDVIRFPTYPLYVAYPTDLSTMLQRIQNRFYRRSTALLWEISCLKKNACAFNEPGTGIVKKAKFLCKLLHEFVSVRDCKNILQLQKMLKKKQNRMKDDAPSSSENEDILPKTSEAKMNGRLRVYSSTDDEQENIAQWPVECKRLLQEVMLMEDSRPFRLQRNSEDNMDDQAMDLTRVQEKLNSNSYAHPSKLLADINLIFVNCKRHNTSRQVHSKSTRLSALLNARIQDIIMKWQNSLSTKPKQVKNGALRRSSRHRKYLHSNLNDSALFELSEHSHDRRSPDPEWKASKQNTCGVKKDIGRISQNGIRTRGMVLRKTERNENGVDVAYSKQNHSRKRRDLIDSHNEQGLLTLFESDPEHCSSHSSSTSAEDGDSSFKTNAPKESQEIFEHSSASSAEPNDNNVFQTVGQRRSRKRRMWDGDEINDDLSESTQVQRLPNRKKRKVLEIEDDSESNEHQTGLNAESPDESEEEDSDNDPSIESDFSSSKFQTKRRQQTESNVHHYARAPTFSRACKLRSTRKRPVRYVDYASDQASDEDDFS